MLSLVHPAPAGNATDPPRRRHGGPRSSCLTLTVEETTHFRAALRNVAKLHFGTFVKLAGALGVPVKTLGQALSRKSPPSAVLVLRVARLAKVPVEAMLYPTLTDASRCPTCGATKGGAA